MKRKISIGILLTVLVIAGIRHVRVGTVRSYDKEGGTGRIYGMYRQRTWRKRSGEDRCPREQRKKSQSDDRTEVEEAP